MIQTTHSRGFGHGSFPRRKKLVIAGENQEGFGRSALLQEPEHRSHRTRFLPRRTGEALGRTGGFPVSPARSRAPFQVHGEENRQQVQGTRETPEERTVCPSQEVKRAKPKYERPPLKRRFFLLYILRMDFVIIRYEPSKQERGILEVEVNKTGMK